MSNRLSRLSRWFCGLCLVLFAGGLIGVNSYLLTANRPPERQWEPVWDVNTMSLPAPSDIQELLNRIEPEPRLKVDGKIGPATIEKWNRSYIQISANAAMKGK